MKDLMKQHIADKMLELMKQKPISRIRITEICAMCEIERSTFYYHFRDKYELVAWIFFRTARNVNVIDIKEAAESVKNMKNEMLFYIRAYEDTSQNALWQYMLEYFAAEYTKAAERILHTGSLDRQLLFSIRLYCYGAIGMTKEWVLNDNVTPAEEVVEMMFCSMPERLQKIYFGHALPAAG